MLKSLNPFQTALVGIFGFAAVFAVMAFSLGWFGGNANTDQGLVGSVTIWGTLPADSFESLVKSTFAEDRSLTVKYVEKTADNIDRDLAEAIAVGVGPDMILIPQDRFMRHQQKIQPLLLPTRSVQDAFIPQAEMYIGSDGVYALPLVVDPVVMYWNRSLFATAGIARPPQYWEEFFNLVPQLTVFSDPLTKSISQSALALGEYVNISHAKEVLSALLLQAGDRIAARDPDTKAITLYFSKDVEKGQESPLEAVLRFYSQFADQNNTAYTWNRVLPDAQNMFVSGKLAIYFGLASEVPDIVRRNPHLDFDVAVFPQLKTAKTTATFGRMYGLSILKGKAAPLALAVATRLSYSPTTADFARVASVAPTQRGLIAKPPADDPRAPIFDHSALISAGWFDPNPAETNSIFAQMINDVGSDNRRLSDAVASAGQQFAQIFHTASLTR